MDFTTIDESYSCLVGARQGDTVADRVQEMVMVGRCKQQ